MSRKFLIIISLIALGGLLLVFGWSRWSGDQSSADGGLEGDSYGIQPSQLPPPAEDDQESATQPTLDNVLAIARSVLEKLDNSVLDYTADLVKRERINGRLGGESKMEVKIRNPLQDEDQPVGLSVYLKFIEPASVAGREVIWIEGANDGKLIAHEVGFRKLLGRIQLEPTGRLAMMGQKYPMTEIGLIRMAEKLIEKGQERERLQNAKIDIVNKQKVGDRDCQLIQLTNPVDDGKAEFHVAQIYVDTERMIPLRYAAYMWPEADGGQPQLEEEYTYLNVRLNVGLTDQDFDPDNPDYDYP